MVYVPGFMKGLTKLPLVSVRTQYSAALLLHPMLSNVLCEARKLLALPVTRPRPACATKPVIPGSVAQKVVSKVVGVAPVVNHSAYGPWNPWRNASVSV